MTIDFAATYRMAANVIRTNGHHKGAFFTRPESGVGIEPTASECPVCIAGALSLAMFDFPIPSTGQNERSNKFEAVARKLADLMGLEGDPLLEPVGRLAAWNDRPERTANDVITALEKAAREVAA
ncbi:DUF6197 family protein [Streptomyces melanosporofaciens]